jgi:hypothetical protein
MVYEGKDPSVQYEKKFWMFKSMATRDSSSSILVFQSLYEVARMGEKRNVYRLLVGKPGGKRPLGRPRRRWIDNIKMDLLEIGVNVVDWIGLAQDRYSWRALVNSVMNLRVP